MHSVYMQTLTDVANYISCNENIHIRKENAFGLHVTLKSIDYNVAMTFITRSHGSVTSVVRATRQVNGRRQIYPSHHTHTP